MAAVWTDGGGSGGGANDSGGNGAELSAVPLLARAMTSWRRGRRQCLRIVGHSTLIGVKLSQRWGGLQCLVIIGIPSLTGATASRQRGARHCRPFPRSLVQRRRQGAYDSGLLLCRRQWGAKKVPRRCCAMAVAVRPTIVPLNSWPSLACSRMARMEAARTD